MKENIENLLIKIIDIGNDIESYHHDDSFPKTGQDGEKEPLSEKVSKAQADALKVSKELLSRGIDIYHYNKGFEYKDEYGMSYTLDDLEQVLQFI